MGIKRVCSPGPSASLLHGARLYQSENEMKPHEISEQVARGLSQLSILLAADHIDGAQFMYFMSHGKLTEWLRDQVSDDEGADWISATILDACDMIEGK